MDNAKKTIRIAGEQRPGQLNLPAKTLTPWLLAQMRIASQSLEQSSPSLALSLSRGCSLPGLCLSAGGPRLADPNTLHPAHPALALPLFTCDVCSEKMAGAAMYELVRVGHDE